MRSADSAHDAAAVWDIATPSRPGLLPGVSMAGFRARTTEFFDLSVIPYPAVTVALSLGDEPFTVDDIDGRQQNGSVVVGLVPSGLRGRGRDIECLQVRLSPVVAHAVLGASSELGGTMVSLDDLWGRDAARTQEQLHAARSWDDRFAIAEAAFVRRHEAGRAIDPEVAFVWRQMVTNLGGFGSSGWQPRSAGAVSDCGPGSEPRSVSTPSAPLSLSVSTTRPTGWPRVTAPHGWRRRSATSTSPTSIGTSWPSPV